MHTPIFWIVICLISVIIGKIQKRNDIEKGSLIIFSGAMLHLVTDWLTARTVGIQWFYPFSETNYWIYSIEPEKGNIPIWNMVIPPYINFYFETSNIYKEKFLNPI